MTLDLCLGNRSPSFGHGRARPLDGHVIIIVVQSLYVLCFNFVEVSLLLVSPCCANVCLLMRCFVLTLFCVLPSRNSDILRGVCRTFICWCHFADCHWFFKIVLVTVGLSCVEWVCCIVVMY